MAKTQLTQDQVDDVCDQLLAEGTNVSTSEVRKVVKQGSFSTIKAMIVRWEERTAKQDNVVIPPVPAFAQRLLEKIHTELYLQHHNALEAECLSHEETKQDFADQEKEMLNEIEFLEKDSEKRNAIFADCIKIEEEKNKKQEVDMIKMQERMVLLEQQLLEAKIREEGSQRVIEMLSSGKSLVELKKEQEQAVYRHKYKMIKEGKTLEWNGRGRMPKWFEEYRRDGGDLEAIRI